MQVITGTLPNSGNYKKGRSGSIKYIVIHYTANHGDTAANNVRYFTNNVVKASAHYFVDENNIYSSVPIYDTAYHCGGGLQGKGGHAWFGHCKNSNSIGIEMCLLDKNGYVRKGTIVQCVELVKYLMKKYSIPPENVIRHWDVTGKNCPVPFTGDNNAYWQDFKNRISIVDEYTDNEHILWELSNRKIISNVNLWRNKMSNDNDIYWLCRKIVHYVRTKSITEYADSAYTDKEQLLWELNHRGIITDMNLWRNKISNDVNVYWLCQKGVHYMRTQKKEI